MTKRERHGTSEKRLTRLALAAAAAVLLSVGAAWADGEGACVRAQIEQTIILPDGSTHPAGEIRICLEREFSPVAGLHEVTIGRDKVGLFLSRRTASEGAPEDDRTKLVFRLGPEGTLVFLGYTVRYQDRMLVYWMRPPKGVRRSDAPGTLTAQLENEPDRLFYVTAENR